MEIQPTYILKQYEPPIILDFQRLKVEMIEHCQRLSGAVWTDYNDHDPGVTLVEQLCYALIELGYKTQLDFEKLFFSGWDGEDLDGQSLYPLHQVLFTGPVTARDYRRLLIDRLPHTHNVWVQSQAASRSFGIWVQPEPGYEQSDQRLEAARSLLASNRNFGEDFSEIHRLELVPVHLSMTLTLDRNVDPVKCIAEILDRIDEFINPSVKLYDFEALQEANLWGEQLFEGPQPMHGFVLEEELERSAWSVMTQPVLLPNNAERIVREQEGVEQCAQFNLYVGGKKISGSDERPRLDTTKHTVLLLDAKTCIDNINLAQPDTDFTKEGCATEFALLRSRRKESLKRPLDFAEVLYTPESDIDPNELTTYYSLQHTFPRIYRLGKHAPGGKASPSTLQLQGYLLLFEQVIVDFLGKLAHFRSLFMIAEEEEEDQAERLFEQFWSGLNHLPGWERLCTKEAKARLKSSYTRLVYGLEQQHKLMDYSLARLGEVIQNREIQAIWSGDQSRFEQDWLEAKKQLLRHFPEFSAKRSQGFNYLQPDSIPSIKKKIGMLTHIPTEHFFFLEKNLLNDRSSNTLMVVIKAGKFNKKKKLGLEELFRKNLPAHLDCRFEWATAKDYSSYFAAYNKWKEELKKVKEKDIGAIVKASSKQVKTLIDLMDPSPTES